MELKVVLFKIRRIISESKGHEKEKATLSGTEIKTSTSNYISGNLVTIPQFLVLHK